MIDWNFIEAVEGKHVLKGYVPKNKRGKVIGKSGVTISTGVDIGQHYVQDLMAYHTAPFSEVSKSLVERLSRYCALKGNDAVQALKVHPLQITMEDSIALANAVKAYKLNTLVEDWNSKSFVNFYKLPDELQTVLFSLGYNFGEKLSYSLPNTFKTMKLAAETKNYRQAWEWMKNFKSKNPELKERRGKEAAILKKLVSF